MASADTLTTLLQASSSGASKRAGSSSLLPPEAAHLAEASSFSSAERSAQKAFCAATLNRGSWLPVLADLGWERTRSRLATVLLLLQVFLKLLLQVYLPRIGLASIIVCGQAL
jgi:hypothetical protein